MTENADKHERAFQYLVRLLEEAATAEATAVELKMEQPTAIITEPLSVDSQVDPMVVRGSTTRSTKNWPQRLPMWQWQEVPEVLPHKEPTGRVVRLMRELPTE